MISKGNKMMQIRDIFGILNGYGINYLDFNASYFLNLKEHITKL